MNHIRPEYEHHRVTLEVERDTLEYRLKQSSQFGEDADIDPFNLLMLRQVRAQLQSVTQALERLANNQFGVCQRCHRPIETDRLLALPTAEMCIGCKRTVDHAHVRPPSRETLKGESHDSPY